MSHTAVSSAKDRIENKIGEYEQLLTEVEVIEDKVAEAQAGGYINEVSFSLTSNYESEKRMVCSMECDRIHAAVHNLIKEHDGDVKWNSSENEYRATFRVSLQP